MRCTAAYRLLFPDRPLTHSVCVCNVCVGAVQWCGIGFSQLPNGIGFGGQVGHFGLWLDHTMDSGMSRPAATFARWVALLVVVVVVPDCRS